MKRDCVFYRADEEWNAPGQWKPSIHMPRWASRITLEIVSVRVERVQDISEHDACSEGVTPYCQDHAPDQTCRGAFMELWDSINAARGFGWDANPHVWVIEFKRLP